MISMSRGCHRVDPKVFGVFRFFYEPTFNRLIKASSERRRCIVHLLVRNPRLWRTRTHTRIEQETHAATATPAYRKRHSSMAIPSASDTHRGATRATARFAVRRSGMIAVVRAARRGTAQPPK